jgi:hypothetical protein
MSSQETISTVFLLTQLAQGLRDIHAWLIDENCPPEALQRAAEWTLGYDERDRAAAEMLGFAGRVEQAARSAEAAACEAPLKAVAAAALRRVREAALMRPLDDLASMEGGARPSASEAYAAAKAGWRAEVHETCERARREAAVLPNLAAEIDRAATARLLGWQAPAAALPLGESEAGTPTIWYHGERAYSSDRRSPKSVSLETHKALQAFLDRAIALDSEAISGRGVCNPSKVMNALARMFPGAVRLPERKGEGYSARVRSTSIQ